jgi:hypothetical protein
MGSVDPDATVMTLMIQGQKTTSAGLVITYAAPYEGGYSTNETTSGLLGLPVPITDPHDGMSKDLHGSGAQYSGTTTLRLQMR